MDHAKLLISKVTWCQDPYSAVSNAEAPVILTEWAEARRFDLVPKILDAFSYNHRSAKYL